MPENLIRRIRAIAWELRRRGTPPLRSIWVETNALTSQSHNQLDLVQKGIHGSLPGGSASLFVPDPGTRDISYSPKIEWRGQTYEDNELKFAGTAFKSTSRSWRLLLNGLTPSGDSLTPQAREHFQNKLLVWFEIAPLHFRLEVFEKDQIDSLRDSGVADQGRRGSASEGKWFGLVELAPDSEGPLESEIQAAAEAATFDPTGVEDARRRIARTIAERLGQPAFRQQVLVAYQDRCCITGYDAPEALEAAHITPYMGEATNRVDNALLLRSDIHTLFDRGLIAIVPDEGGTLKVKIAERLAGTTYRALEGASVWVPDEPALRPSLEALRAHFEQSACY